MTPSTTTGLGGATLRRRRSPAGDGAATEPGRPTIVTALSSGTDAPLQLLRIPTDDRTADEPRNPANRVDTTTGEYRAYLESLARSIAQQGLLAPVLVSPADRWRAANPDVTVADLAEWVLRAGHRRRAACRLGKEMGLTGPARPTPESWDWMEAILREDDASLVAIIGTRLGENVHRLDLSPLQEARDLDFLRTYPETPLTQRELADVTGISQAQISKRLALLTLDPAVQDAIEAKELAVVDALQHFKSLPAAQQIEALKLLQASRTTDPGTDAAPLTAAAAVRQVLTGAAAAPEVSAASPGAAPGAPAFLAPGQERAAAERAAGDQEEPYQDDAGDTPGPPASPRQGGDRADDEPDDFASSSAATASGVATDATASDERSGQDDAGAELAQPEQLDEQAAAAAARAAACRQAVQTSFKARELQGLLIDVTLDPPRARPSAAIEVAAGWLGLEVPGSPEDLAAEIIARGGKPAEQMAAAVALARREADLVGTRGGAWDAAACRHVERLTALGVHQITDYEREQIARAAE